MKQKNSLNKFLDRLPVFTDEDYVWINDNSCLTERDFYPPLDNRNWKSNIDDINGGDNFADYCKYIFAILNNEEYWDN